jgi:RNA polymerase sigma-70 factor (family 1)
MADIEYIKRLLASISINNDQAAYKELFVLLQRPLRQFAYSILKSGEEADELVSDVFIRIWQKRDRLCTIESPLFYFYTTAKNMALNRIKQQKKHSLPLSSEWLMQMNSVWFDPEKLLITEEMMRQIRNAINSLPPRCMLIFKLVKEDGLKYREVADLLGLSIKTIEAQMAIALRRIGKCMHFDIKTSYPSLLAEKK